MPWRTLVQACDAEMADLVARLLEQYHHRCRVAASVEETRLLARSHGPIDLAICLDDGEKAGQLLESSLRELCPGTRILRLPSLHSVEDGTGGKQLGGTAVWLTPTDLLELVEAALAPDRSHPQPPDVTVDTLKDALVETILSFSLLIEQYEFVNGGNSRLIMEYSMRVARELGLSPIHTEEVGYAALLQDVGLVKLRASTRSRARSGVLEHEQVRDHPLHSANFVQRMRLPWRIRHIVAAHHEWYNGLGYPLGLHGRSIPLGARILSVVNAFYSLISRRPSRPPLAKTAALEELRRLAGRQFDPEVVWVFLRLMKHKTYHDEARPSLGVVILTGDDLLGTVASSRFQTRGDRATVCGEGASALALLRHNTPDALVLDVMLRDMSGYQLLHWVKQDPLLRDVPVLMIGTESDCDAHRFMAQDMGASDFLLRPLSPVDLVQRVEALARRRSRIARAEAGQIHEGEGLRGSLDEISVTELVRMLHEGRKTALVTFLHGESRALLAFDRGSLVHARAEALVGEEAFWAILKLAGGDFVTEYGAATAERTVGRRTDLLLCEAADPARTPPRGSIAPSDPTPAASQTIDMGIAATTPM